MYLGVHTPLDVGVSLLVAFVLVAVLYPVFKSEESFHKYMPFVVIGSVAVTLAFFIYVNVISPEGHEAVNLESGMKNGATLFGCMLGLLVVYPIDRFVTKFETGGKWYAQVIKLVLGLIGVLLIKELGRPVLEALVGIFTPAPVYIARAIRYFLIVVFAGAVWPLSFGFFKHLTIPALDRFGERVSAIFKKRTTVAEGAEPTAGEANGEGSEG